MFYFILLCSPELEPQMTGGVVEGEVMVKVSVWSQLYKNRSSRKMDSQRQLSRE